MAPGNFTEKVEIKDSQDRVAILLDASTGKIIVSRPDPWAVTLLGVPLPLRPVFSLETNPDTVYLLGDLRIGSPDKAGVQELLFHNDNGQLVMKDGSTLQDRIRFDANLGDLCLGGNGSEGDLLIFPVNGDNKTPNQASIHLEGQRSKIYLGGRSSGGDLLIFTANVDNKTPNQASIHLEGQTGTIYAGGKNDTDGEVVLRNRANQNTIHLHGQNGNISVGGNGTNGSIELKDGTGQTTIHLLAETGDIQLVGADCAEDFSVSESQKLDPGTVLVVDGEDKLSQSREAYDKRAIGVVSGAGDCRPGIVLNKRNSKNMVPVALTGKVYCKVDASYSPIEVGDLLTTSPTPGHAMKATDPSKSFGAVIGKALGILREGRGIIPILVALQ